MTTMQIDQVVETLRSGLESDKAWKDKWLKDADSETIEGAIMAVMLRAGGRSTLQRIAEEIAHPKYIQNFNYGFLAVHAIITDMVNSGAKVHGKFVELHMPLDGYGWFTQLYGLSDEKPRVESPYRREGGLKK